MGPKGPHSCSDFFLETKNSLSVANRGFANCFFFTKGQDWEFSRKGGGGNQLVPKGRKSFQKQLPGFFRSIRPFALGIRPGLQAKDWIRTGPGDFMLKGGII